MRKKTNTLIRPILKNMRIMDRELFALEKSRIVRNTCSELSLSTGMKFTTQQFNADLVIEVTRVS